MVKFYKVKLFILFLTFLVTQASLVSSSSSNNDTFVNDLPNNNSYDFITEKNFIHSVNLGDCCLIAGMATLPGNAELRDHVMQPSGQNFTLGNQQSQFNIYKLGKLHRVKVDVNDLPITSKNELLYSSSANDNMIGPLLEKAFVDLYFDGDYLLPKVSIRPLY